MSNNNNNKTVVCGPVTIVEFQVEAAKTSMISQESIEKKKDSEKWHQLFFFNLLSSYPL